MPEIKLMSTDDAIYVWPTSSIHVFTNGSWSSINTVDDQWGNLYTGIRAANIFLESYQEDFPDNQYNVDYEEQMKQYRYYPYEARFLRAFFYFELIKRYKNVRSRVLICAPSTSASVMIIIL